MQEQQQNRQLAAAIAIMNPISPSRGTNATMVRNADAGADRVRHDDGHVGLDGADENHRHPDGGDQHEERHANDLVECGNRHEGVENGRQRNLRRNGRHEDGDQRRQVVLDVVSIQTVGDVSGDDVLDGAGENEAEGVRVDHHHLEDGEIGHDGVRHGGGDEQRRDRDNPRPGGDECSACVADEETAQRPFLGEGA